MTLDALKGANRVIGVKQVGKAVRRGEATQVFLASDADARVIEPLRALCGEQGIPVDETAQLKDLGAACGIEVGAAAAALTKPLG